MKLLLENKKQVIFVILLTLFIIWLKQEKQYDDDFYKTYANKTNLEMQKLQPELKGIAYSFSQENNISDSYKETMHDCIGYYIYHEASDSQLINTLKLCKDEYIQNKGKSVYYNQAWLLKEISEWNGSYLPLERIVQKHIRKPESYEHLKTEYSMHFDDERPHMYVTIDYKGVNMYGKILKQAMSVKVDAKTKEMYELQNLVR